jgi:hypothetical protein
MADAKKSGGGTASRSRQATKAGEPSSNKLVKILLMFICCAAAGYFFWTTMQIIETSDDALQQVIMPQPPDPATENEKREIQAAEEGLQNMSKSSSQAMFVALHAETQAKLPVDLPTSLVRRDPTPDPVPGEIVVEPDPPAVTVVILYMDEADKVRVANANVDGKEGVLLKVGTKFAEGKARVTKIDEKGVTFVWMRKSILAPAPK